MVKWCDSALLSERLYMVTLAVTWVSLVSWKAIIFHSEPTASTSYWESRYERPVFTVCPEYRIKNSVQELLEFGTPEEREQRFGNTTLLHLFRTEGMGLFDFLPELIKTKQWSDDPERTNFSDAQAWYRTVDNFVDGGTCITVAPRDTAENVMLLMQRFYSVDLDGFSSGYSVAVQRQDDFWGALDSDMSASVDPEMVDLFLDGEDVFSFDVTVQVDREIRPDLRRRPCEADPGYSLMNCWRKCWTDWLPCRVEPGDTSDKPFCMATDFKLYQKRFRNFSERLRGQAEPPVSCSCPIPCVRDRFSFSVKSIPKDPEGRDGHIHVALKFAPVQRTMEVYVTYTLTDFLADTGGYLGLLLGYSLLSVVAAVRSATDRVGCRTAGANSGREEQDDSDGRDIPLSSSRPREVVSKTSY